MTGTARFLTNAAFTFLVAFGVLGGLFVAGYAFADLSTWAAIGSTAAWLVPILVLAAVARWWRDRAPAVFVTLTVLVAGLTVLDSAFGFVDRDAAGPVAAIGVFSLGVSLAFLGLYRTALAGLLLVVLGVAQLAATALGFVEDWQGGGGPGLGHLLTTSSGIVVVPLLLAGTLFLIAGALSHESVKFWHLPPATPLTH